MTELRAPRAGRAASRTRRHGAWIARALGCLVAAGLALVSAPARSADAVINFDDLPAFTGVTTQYHGLGVDLGGGMTVAGAPIPARTGPNYLEIGTSGEFSVPNLRGTFTNPHHTFVQFWVWDQPAKDIELRGYDLGHNLVARQQITRAGTNTYRLLRISTDRPIIASFETGGSAGGNGGEVDDLRFDAIGDQEQPDFGLQTSNATITLLPGSIGAGGPGRPGQIGMGPTGAAPVTLLRRAGSNGDIQFSVSGLPRGVTVASIQPNPAAGTSTGDVVVTLQASALAPPVINWPFQVVGNPASGASGGYGAHATSLRVTVLDSYDAQIVGLEVTQGIQGYDLPQKPSALSTAPVSYNQPGREGVPLVAGAETHVRVFANIRTPTVRNPTPRLMALLNGFRDGQLLPGSPLAGYFQKDLQTGPDTVDTDHRSGKRVDGVLDATLPLSWTSGTITLEARLSVAPSFWPPFAAQDTTPEDDAFTLTDVAFTPTRPLGLVPVALDVDGLALPSPDEVLEGMRNLMPVADGGLHVLSSSGVGVYGGHVNITDVWNQATMPCPPGTTGPCAATDTYRGTLALDRLQSLVDHADFLTGVSGALVVGVQPGSDALAQIRSASRPCKDGPVWSCDDKPVAVVQGYNRPLTTVAHEIGHLLGRLHASAANGGGSGGQKAEAWPPDEKGFLQGVGYDRRTGRVLYAPKDGSGTQLFDFMSYAAFAGNNDPDSWISVPGWKETVSTLAIGAPGEVKAFSAEPPLVADAARIMQAGQPSLLVRGFVDDRGVVTLTEVGPGVAAPPTQNDPASPYRAVLRDGAGAVIANAGFEQMPAHVDDADTNPTLLVAQVPAVGVQSVQIVANGQVLAERRRSPHAPDVTVTGVLTDGVRAGVRVTTLRWRASDADGDPLTARVDFSADGGATWRPVYLGPSTGLAALESAMLDSSPNGLLRVAVSDGFNETVAQSAPFLSSGAGPRVRVLSPHPGQQIHSGTTLVLSGAGLDQSNGLLPDANLAWYVDDAQVAQGTASTVSGLAPGTHRVRLTGTDARGRSRSQVVSVDVLP